MGKTGLGAIVAGLVQWVIGAICWVGFGNLAFKVADDNANAALQAAMAQTLTATGTGTYQIPWPESAAGTVMHGKGPVALVMFNTGGFPVMNLPSLIEGLALSIVMMLLVGLALRHVAGFANRVQVMLMFAIAFTLYFALSLPVFNYYLPWGWWIFLAIEEFLAFAVGAFVMIRWFMPADSAAPAATLP